MIPAGSQRSLSMRRTSWPSRPVSASSHGAWSAPTAWWWEIVPPAATIASIAAALARRHWPAGSARSWAANAVK